MVLSGVSVFYANGEQEEQEQEEEQQQQLK